MFFGKTVGDNVAGFKSRISQHISACRTATCEFPIHVYHCAKKKEMFGRTIYSIKYNDETKRQSAIRIL